MRGFDVTSPVAEPTGREKTAEQLSRPDERNERIGCGLVELQASLLQVEESLNLGVPENVRERLRRARLVATYGYFAYELFSESVFVSISSIEQALKAKFREVVPAPYSLVRRRRNNEQQRVATDFSQLLRLLRARWRIPSLPAFNGSLAALLRWARESSVLPADTPLVLQELVHRYNNRFLVEVFPDIARDQDLLSTDDPSPAELEELWRAMTDEEREVVRPTNADVLADEVPNLRNRLAHPDWVNRLALPRTAVFALAQAVEIANALWPEQPPPEG